MRELLQKADGNGREASRETKTVTRSKTESIKFQFQENLNIFFFIAQIIIRRHTAKKIMADSLLIEEAPSFAGDDLASSVIVEPPAAADAVASVGTLPPAAMQFADLTESGSESGEDEPNSSEQQQQQQQQLESSSSNGAAGHNTPAARSSPPPNCAICLSRCRRKCFTDSCMHQFCFKCLSEWSKVSESLIISPSNPNICIFFVDVSHRLSQSVRSASNPSGPSYTMCAPWMTMIDIRWNRIRPSIRHSVFTSSTYDASGTCSRTRQ